MKKDEVPQDDGSLSKGNLKELVYATDEGGRYTTALSSGWEPKSIALSQSLDAINERVADALAKVKGGEASVLYYLMELHRMDVPVLAGYAGTWQWRVKRHFKPEVFEKLDDKTMKKYADAFGMTPEALRHFKPE
jgi:hypothetical protein